MNDYYWGYYVTIRKFVEVVILIFFYFVSSPIKSYDTTKIKVRRSELEGKFFNYGSFQSTETAKDYEPVPSDDNMNDDNI